jgi:hypothetical protein
MYWLNKTPHHRFPRVECRTARVHAIRLVGMFLSIIRVSLGLSVKQEMLFKDALDDRLKLHCGTARNVPIKMDCMHSGRTTK